MEKCKHCGKSFKRLSQHKCKTEHIVIPLTDKETISSLKNNEKMNSDISKISTELVATPLNENIDLKDLEKSKKTNKRDIFVKTKGVLIYLFDETSMNGKKYFLPFIDSICEIKDTNERFYLDKTAYILDGIPYWVVIRGLVHSVKYIYQDNSTLIQMSLTARDMNIACNSMVVEKTYGKYEYSTKEILNIILFGVSVCVITILIYSLVLQNVYNINPILNTNIGNSTVGVLRRLMNSGN